MLVRQVCKPGVNLLIRADFENILAAYAGRVSIINTFWVAGVTL
jgi:hypothetical protein